MPDVVDIFRIRYQIPSLSRTVAPDARLAVFSTVITPFFI